MPGSLDKSNETKLEFKIVTDSKQEINDKFLNIEGDQGWILVNVINSRLGRSFDRYYFQRILK